MSKIKLVVFDMDGTLIEGRSIFIFAEKIGFKEDLLRIINSNIKPYKKTIEIAKFLKNINTKTLIRMFREIPLQKDVDKVIKKLKNNNIMTAILTDSYQFVADDLRRRLGIDFAFANNLITEKNIITGEVILHNNKLIEDFIGHEIYSICKSCVLEQLCNKLKIKVDETIAVGDGLVDNCMLEKAGLGIAFKSSNNVKKHADIAINDMNKILKYI
jgi:phosphoserine phosphatase